ncbi:MAG: hypothetical protein GYA55_05555 [SAR324 cluster bacterium]|uniref:Cell division protein FtsX n=1 Tax=SAR324 cluster bacterium TaxID=2024889 RepID=A0A7X9FRS3_9DELT|nr:hypothetical protein [SAR324 cluster bacterium]
MKDQEHIYNDEMEETSTAYPKLLEVWSESDNLEKSSFIAASGNLLVGVVKSITREPLTAMLSILTLTTALFLFSIFLIFVEHIEHALIKTQSEITLSIYLKNASPEGEVEALQSELQRLEEVKSIIYLSKNDALEAFRKSLGANKGVLDGIEAQNPLPASFELHFKEGKLEAEQLNKLTHQLRNKTIVEQMHYNESLLDRMSGLLSSFRAAALMGGVLMLIMTAFIMWNTIRLALYSHREELRVHKLLGSTDAAIILPYVVEGFIKGLLSALLSLSILLMCVELLPKLLEHVGEFKTIIPQIHNLSILGTLLVLMCGAGIALLSSFFAARAFIREQREL